MQFESPYNRPLIMYTRKQLKLITQTIKNKVNFANEITEQKSGV